MDTHCFLYDIDDDSDNDNNNNAMKFINVTEGDFIMLIFLQCKLCFRICFPL